MFPSIQFPTCRISHTRIVATIGPASESEEMLAELIRAGVDVFRLNMAHAKIPESQEKLNRIRRVSEKLGLTVAILADLAGPKIRLGEIPGGCYECRSDQEVTFVRGTTTTAPDTFTTTYAPLIDDLVIGSRVMLADGTVVLEVVSVNSDSATCRIVQGGVVRSRQGVNIPGTKLSIRTLQEADKKNAEWATQVGVDFLGLSFVRSPDDIHELRGILQSTATESGMQFIPHIIAKIEKPEALERLDEIIEASDGVMVARGDLGVETDIARIAVVQKRIIAKCREHRRPVIVATQMLESMTTESLPTRAEATDVANAILDGTDAVMLSGETAVGKQPVQVVEMMHRIAIETEKLMHQRIHDGCQSSMTKLPKDTEGHLSVSDALCETAGRLADEIGAVMVMVSSRSGRTILSMANQRRFAMTIGLSPFIEVLRRSCLYWGVIPVPEASGVPSELLQRFVEAGCDAGYLKPKDRIVLLGGFRKEESTQRHIYIHEVPEKT